MRKPQKYCQSFNENILKLSFGFEFPCVLTFNMSQFGITSMLFINYATVNLCL
jgi:hypothetical protein